MDISEEELARNHTVDYKVCSDVTKAIPFPKELPLPGIVCSECVMEHLENNVQFIELSAQVIADGGYFIALIPNKFALFSIINQILGNELGKKVLKLVGKKTENNGFKAYYHCTYPSAVAKILKKNGFCVVEQRFSYSSSGYFDFFFPAYFLSCCYEWAVKSLQLRNLCSYFIIVAQKNPACHKQGMAKS